MKVGDDIDDQISRLQRSGARWARAETAFAWLLVIVLTSGMVGAFMALAVYDEQQQDACIDNGGHVEQVHGSSDGGWVCIGGTP